MVHVRKTKSPSKSPAKGSMSIEDAYVKALKEMPTATSLPRVQRMIELSGCTVHEAMMHIRKHAT